MSLVDAPLALLDRVLGRRRVAPDDPLVRHLSETLARLEPDPLFQRRLRGEAINHYVAGSEMRLARRDRARREMGRLGRSVLYASVALALGVTAVGAAAQEALPGDALYLVKLRLEELRIEIAPASLRPQLVSLVLDERLGELERLTALGAWPQAERAASLVERAAARLAAFGLGPATPGDQAVERHAEVLNRLLAEVPEPARPGLEHAIAASGAATGADVGADAATPGKGHPGGGGPSADTRSRPSPAGHQTGD
jgi:hypothetical protein